MALVALLAVTSAPATGRAESKPSNPIVTGMTVTGVTTLVLSYGSMIGVGVLGIDRGVGKTCSYSAPDRPIFQFDDFWPCKVDLVLYAAPFIPLVGPLILIANEEDLDRYGLGRALSTTTLWIDAAAQTFGLLVSVAGAVMANKARRAPSTKGSSWTLAPVSEVGGLSLRAVGEF